MSSRQIIPHWSAALALSFAFGHTAWSAPESVKPTANTTKKAEPRYSISFGKGWAVCEAYAGYLNSLPASELPPVCDLKLQNVSGMKEPEWQELPIEPHLDWVHQIELIMGRSYIDPEPLADFELWKAQRVQRISRLQQSPRLRKARVATVFGAPPSTVLHYEVDTQLCQKEEEKLRSGKSAWMPDSSTLAAIEESTGKVRSTFAWGASQRGTLWLYQDTPYYFLHYFGYGRGSDGDTLAIRRVEQVIDPLLLGKSTTIIKSMLGDQQYADRELCEIRFAGIISLLNATTRKKN
jgi:hypothetical protein